MPAPHNIRPADLAALPIEDRKVIARWICERADQIRPSIYCTPDTVEAITGVLYGIAVDLADPESDDSTVQHAREVLATIDVQVPTSS